MKRNIYLLAMIITANCFSQYSQPNINVTVQKQQSIGGSLSEISKAGAMSRAAKAKEIEARAIVTKDYNEAKKDNSTEITTDFLIGNSQKFKWVVVENVSGWKVKGNTENLMDILVGAKKYIIINTTRYYRTDRKIPKSLINNPQVLFLNWQREAQGDFNRLTKLSLKDFEGKTIYEANYKNKPYSEMLKPLTSDYVFTKSQAITQIQEYKKLMDLKIVTPEEYIKLVSKLKPIILGEN
jgi:hypothetical protein